ncbi:M48 family metalloprotease [Sphingomonas sp. MMS24-J13]|uniref:M48 family metalloprotease n=1 Tax=Sphingomonas sp. MMS24-J13 TaxID=3238686 RepID=UPI00384ECCA4
MFGFDGDSGIEAIVPSSPAEASGIRAGDGLVGIGSFSVPAVSGSPDGKARLEPLTALYEALFALPPDQPFPIVLRRGDEEVRVVIQPRPACRARFEVLLGRGYIADANGETIRVGAGIMARLSDGKLAAIVAHEIAHNILGHARLSEEQHVRGGLAGIFGRSARLTRAMEDAADRLSLRLLANAGYDPHDAVALWQEDGGALTGWMPINTSYRNWRSRANLLEAELAAMRAGSKR